MWSHQTIFPQHSRLCFPPSKLLHQSSFVNPYKFNKIDGYPINNLVGNTLGHENMESMKSMLRNQFIRASMSFIFSLITKQKVSSVYYAQYNIQRLRMGKGEFQQKSKFHAYRSKYNPRVPIVLTSNALESKTAEATILPEIAKIFPHIVSNGVKSVSFEQGEQGEKIIDPLRVGCVLSGGQAAGGHNVIVGLYDYIKRRHQNSQLFGFLNGPKGIYTGKYIELTEEIIHYFKNRGGFDMICSGRDKIEKLQHKEMSLKYCESLKLDGLVVIGGDDSNTNAALLAQFFLEKGSKIRVVGCPKTIDGDLKNEFVEVSFGFDTACKTYSECIGSIMADTLSSKKYYHFIRLMGRSASHIALECALLTRPTYAFIGEEVEQKKQTLSQLVNKLVDIIVARGKNNKDYGVILVPEGLIQFIPQVNVLIKQINKLIASIKEIQFKDLKELVLNGLTTESKNVFNFLPPDISEQLLLDRDPHGNVQVAKIETEKLIIQLVLRALKNKQDYAIKKFKPLANYFGYEGRCAFPTNFDCDYCYSLGLNAAAIVQSGLTGLMSCVRNLNKQPEEWQAGGYPLVTMMNIEHRKGQNVPVIKKALVELDGVLFKLYESKRDEWSQGDYFNMVGPIQYQFPTPKPYLAVPPTENDLYIESKHDYKLTQKSFASIHDYNFNQLTYQLSQQKSRFPAILKQGARIVHGQSFKYHSKELNSLVKEQYPFLYANESKLITFGKHEQSQASHQHQKRHKHRIGVCFNGRQFPGGHNIIQGLLCDSTEVIGFLWGNKGLFEKKYIPITQEMLQPYVNQSGFYLLGRNSDKIRTQQEREKVRKTCEQLQLDGLVIVGASHTLTDVASLSDYFIKHDSHTKVIGIPASIDNNVSHQKLEACIGFATSSHTYSTLISNLMIDASSNTKYWYFIRLMGRDPSHLALECALSTRPNYTVISEEVHHKGWDLEELVDDIVRVVIRRQEKGLGFGCVLVPEGLPHYLQSLKRIQTELDQIKSSDQKVIERKMSEWAFNKYKGLPDFIKTQLTLRDNHGALSYSQIESERLLAVLVQRKLKELKSQGKYKGSFSPVCHFFGYQGRCALPSRLDQNLAITYGLIAKTLIENKVTGYCPSVRGLERSAQSWYPIAIPFVQMLEIKQKSQFGHNKAIVISSDVNLKSTSFRYFVQKRGEWELNDHYASPGPIQFYGESSSYIPLSLSLEEKYDFDLIEKIQYNLHQLKNWSKFGAEGRDLRIIHNTLSNLLSTLELISQD